MKIDHKVSIKGNNKVNYRQIVSLKNVDFCKTMKDVTTSVYFVRFIEKWREMFPGFFHACPFTVKAVVRLYYCCNSILFSQSFKFFNATYGPRMLALDGAVLDLLNMENGIYKFDNLVALGNINSSYELNYYVEARFHATNFLATL